MIKNKPKVSFYGKDMNLFRAKLFSYELRRGLVNITLTEEDLEKYSLWKERKEKGNKRVGERIFKKINEKEYLIEELENKIKATKKERKKKGILWGTRA